MGARAAVGALPWRRAIVACALLTLPTHGLRAEDGHELWLRYRLVKDTTRLREYRSALSQLVVPGRSARLDVARAELVAALRALLGAPVSARPRVTRNGALLVGTPATLPGGLLAQMGGAIRSLGDEGFLLAPVTVEGRRVLLLAANRDAGIL